MLFYVSAATPALNAQQSPSCLQVLDRNNLIACSFASMEISGITSSLLDLKKISNASRSDYLNSHLAVYGGLHYDEIMSLHVYSNFQERTVKGQDYQDEHNQTVDAAFFQLGNPYNLKALSFASGLIDTSFGLNYSPISKSLALFKDESYWLPQTQASRLTITSNLRTQLELSFSQDISQSLRQYERYPNNQTKSIRLSHDIAALEGTKLILSSMIGPNGKPSYNFASFNQGSSGSASFEWIRRYNYNESNDFDQIFGVNYLSPWTEDYRWLLEYESERNRAWMGTLGLEWKLTQTLDWQLEGAYRSFPNKETLDRLIFSINLELKI